PPTKWPGMRAEATAAEAPRASKQMGSRSFPSLQGDENYKPSSATFFRGSFGSSAERNSLFIEFNGGGNADEQDKPDDRDLGHVPSGCVCGNRDRNRRDVVLPSHARGQRRADDEPELRSAHRESGHCDDRFERANYVLVLERERNYGRRIVHHREADFP